jgi:hypothetical protein
MHRLLAALFTCLALLLSTTVVAQPQCTTDSDCTRGGCKNGECRSGLAAPGRIVLQSGTGIGIGVSGYLISALAIVIALGTDSQGASLFVFGTGLSVLFIGTPLAMYAAGTALGGDGTWWGTTLGYLLGYGIGVGTWFLIQQATLDNVTLLGLSLSLALGVGGGVAGFELTRRRKSVRPDEEQPSTPNRRLLWLPTFDSERRVGAGLRLEF